MLPRLVRFLPSPLSLSLRELAGSCLGILLGSGTFSVGFSAHSVLKFDSGFRAYKNGVRVRFEPHSSSGSQGESDVVLTDRYPLRSGAHSDECVPAAKFSVMSTASNLPTNDPDDAPALLCKQELADWLNVCVKTVVIA